MKRRGRWVRVLAGALLVAGAGLGPSAGGDEPDATLRELLKPLSPEVVPLRLRVAVTLPPSRVPGPPGAGGDEDHRVSGLRDVVHALASSAGFTPAADGAGGEGPLLALELKGTDDLQEPGPAGDGPRRLPRLVARVQGTLALARPGAAPWTVRLAGQASRALSTSSDALRIDAPFAAAVGDTPLIPRLLDLVRARGRAVEQALLAAADAAYDPWFACVVGAVEPTGAAALASLCVTHLSPGDGPLAATAASLLTWLGLEGRQGLLGAPDDGPLLYRWRRLRALAALAGVDPPDPRLPAVMRRALGDVCALVRTTALRGLAAAQGRGAAEDLVAALSDPQPCVAGHARFLLESLTGQKHGADAAAWRAGLAGGAGRDPAAPGRPVDVPLLPFGVRPVRGGPAATVTPGTVPAADATVRALHVLLRLQRADGTWPVADVRFASHETGLTALAVLAFQSAGHGAESPGAFGAAVRRGLDALRAAQSDGGGGRIGESCQGCEVGHAFATLALLEAWAERPGAALRRAADDGLAWIARARNPYFAWRYGVQPGDNDSFVAAAMQLPLLAARAANQAAVAAGYGAPFSLDAEAFEGLEAWYDKMTERGDGLVGYTARGVLHNGYTVEPRLADARGERALTLTAAGALFRAHQGATPRTDALLAAQLRRLTERAPSWPSPGREVDLLHWWFQGLLFGALPKEPQARAWDQAVSAALGAALREDGLTAEVRWGWLGGEAYAAALAALVLTAREFRPLADPARADLARTVGDARMPVAQRAAALTAWIRVAPAKAAPVALGWLRGQDAALRSAAAGALLAAPALAVPALPALTKSWGTLPDPSRADLVRLLAAMAGSAPAAQALLTQALADPAPRVRLAAAGAWPADVPLPEAALPALEPLLDGAEASAARVVLGLLLRPPVRLTLGRAAVALAHADPALRREAAAALGAALGDGPQRLALLGKAAADADPGVRAATAPLLGALEGAEGLAPLTALLEDADEAVGRAATQALSARATRHAPAVEAVLAALGAQSPRARRRAAEVLARLGPAVAHVKPALHEAIKAEVGRGLSRDLLVVLALAEARWQVTQDATAVAGILQGVLTDREASAEVVIRTIELMGRLPEASDHEATTRLLSGRTLGGPIGLAVLNAVADMGGRGTPYLDRLRHVVAQWPKSSELYAYAEVALRRVQAR